MARPGEGVRAGIPGIQAHVDREGRYENNFIGLVRRDSDGSRCRHTVGLTPVARLLSAELHRRHQSFRDLRYVTRGLSRILTQCS
ncbi:Uncharacterised protein [Mycobacteroides abscessus subsp. massiliense]|nr:Uncharacterised protein [Mycobacteroides abscessus subsp. massiliense]